MKNNHINLLGWILFIISAVGFIISSIGYVRFNYSGKWTDFKVRAESLDDSFIDCEVVELPFYDKDKLIPRGKDTTIP